MALATKCPHCNTIFRVAHDQLKLRGGIVRCGSCHEVFDGNAALVLPQAAPAAPAPSIAASAPAPTPLPPALPLEDKLAALDSRAATALQDAPADPAYALALDHEERGTAAAIHLPPASTPVSAPVSAPASAPVAAPVAAPVSAPVASPVDAAEDDVLLDFDLDLNIDEEAPRATAPPSASADPRRDSPTELLPEPAPAASGPDPELDLQLDIESMSDAELEAALAAELAAIAATEAELAHEAAELERVATAAPAVRFSFAAPQPEAEPQPQPQPEPEPLLDLHAAYADDGRREPTLDEAAFMPVVDAAAPAEALEPAAGGSQYYDELLDDDEAALVQLSHGARLQAAPRPAPASADAAPAAALPASASSPAAAGSAEEPGFVKRDRRQQKLRKATSIGMALASLLLLATLGGQIITTFRNPLAAHVPALKPALSAVCAVLGCTIELPAQIDFVTIEQGELQTLTETTFAFSTLLRNQSSTAQAWPHIELILDDASEQAILRRVFSPRDYLPDASVPAAGFAPHTEQSVKLYFELGQLKASGYHIAVFYP